MPVKVTTKIERSTLCPLAIAATVMVLATPAAQAMDCLKASAAIDKAICGNRAALAADVTMSKAFTELKSNLSAGEAASLVSLQKDWLLERASCAEKNDTTVEDCAREITESWTGFLAGKSASGPGARSRFQPFWRLEPGGSGKTKINIKGYHFVGSVDAAETAFNAEVDKMLADVPQADAGDVAAKDWDFFFLMSLDYASPKFISAHTINSTYVGGPHPNDQTHTINFDMAKGRVAKFEEFFNKPAAEKIFRHCYGEVVQTKKISDGKDFDGTPANLKTLQKTVAEVTSDLSLWTFNREGAFVTYDADVVGPHGEGVFICNFKPAALRALLKPEAPLN